MNIIRRFALPICILVAGAVWLPMVARLHRVDTARFQVQTGMAPDAAALAESQLRLWRDPQWQAAELARMRQRNPEWDFMGRTFFVLALANISLREPARTTECLGIMDAIIDETLALESAEGMYVFLLDYARGRPWVMEPVRSQFLDGEIAMMLAARCYVADRPAYREALRERVALMTERMQRGPVLCAESYPDECWLFCNSIGLAAIRMADGLDGTDHSELLTAWLATAQGQLTDPQTGMLIAACTVEGQPHPAGPGPEGSSIFLTAHMLELLDADYAQDQYRRARAELGREFLGFGYAREWPEGVEAQMDIDSGPIIPVIDASAGASGLAILGAAAFHDDAYLAALLGSLEFAGFPVREGDSLRFAASNGVGDAVMLYALVQGPLWARVQETRPYVD